VRVTLHGEVQDWRFLRFLEKVGRDRLASFTTQDLLVLDLLSREEPVPESLKPRLGRLVDQGIVESVGRGRGAKYLLSRQFSEFLGQPGAYTRRRGLDKETNKALLLKHIRDSGAKGTALKELQQVLPALSESQVQKLLAALRAEGQIHGKGRGPAARWYPGPERPAADSDGTTTES
jgi:ATP-dependent DNA helicase RecG